MKNFNNITLVSAVILLLCSPFISLAQNDGYLYGKVTTIDDKEYTGAIRWGKEEVFWTDLFNASKERNENLDFLSRRDREDLERDYYRNNGDWGRRVSNWFGSDWYRNGDNDFKHQFVVQFGEIESIRPYRRQGADLVLRSGEKVEVEGQGYNDIGTDVKVMDDEIGEIELDWDRIESIQFMKAPSKFDKFGEALYGTVETYNGTFTGYVQWDHDERLSTDKLDGKSEDGDVSIAFGKIASIDNDGRRSDVQLKSGRRLTLYGTNDVNYENRGIIVTSEEFGRVDIPWREFKGVKFTDPKDKLVGYGEYSRARDLTGTVKVQGGETLEGRIIFDLDETKDYEILHGEDDELQFLIPFRQIKYISPKSYRYSNIELKNGTKLTLGNAQDVSDKNTGILVFTGGADPTYVRWEDVREITFN